MKNTNSLKSFHQTQTPSNSSTNQSTGELRIRQLIYSKDEMRQQNAGRPLTHQTRLQIMTHKLSKANRTQQYRGEETQSPFFENFFSAQPTETTKGYRFRLPCIVEQQENSNVQIHFLEGFIHSQQLVETYINECRKIIQQTKKEYEEIKEQMKIMDDDTKMKLDETVRIFQKEIARIQRVIKEDFVAHQTEQFRLNKQVTILVKEKIQIEQDISLAQNEIKQLELKLQGVECYDLLTDDPLLNTITQSNLRPDRTQYTFKSVIH